MGRDEEEGIGEAGGLAFGVEIGEVKGGGEGGFGCRDGGVGGLFGGGGADEGEDCGNIGERGGADCGG